jgi:hypothetical protein
MTSPEALLTVSMKSLVSGISANARVASSGVKLKAILN